jgi:hypothetical protein
MFACETKREAINSFGLNDLQHFLDCLSNLLKFTLRLKQADLMHATLMLINHYEG